MVAILTAIGLVGPVVIFLAKVLPNIENSPMGACSLDTVISLFVLFGVALALLAGLAWLGLLMFRRQSPWGPLVLILCNLLMMAFYGVDNPVDPGEFVWAGVVVVIAAAPATAGALVLWPLLTRWRLWARAVELVIVTLIALPVVWLYGSGVATDIRTAVATPPPAASVHLFIAPQRPPAGCASRPGSL
ncbi:MAG TPA: hypothetical protein VF956_05605 [Candidatus Dormibacteraeota bacterium]